MNMRMATRRMQVQEVLLRLDSRSRAFMSRTSKVPLKHSRSSTLTSMLSE